MIAALEDPNEVLNGVIIRDVYDYVMDNYVTISQAEVNANLDTSNEPIDTSRTLAVCIRKQKLFQEMDEDANVPITKATMVTMGTKHAVATSGMDDARHGWMWLPNDQQTWVCWKTMWGGAFLKKRKLVRLTGIAYNGMVNEAAEMQICNTMAVALDNLANSAVQKNNTVERLVISKSSLSASLAVRDTKITRILTVITNLSTRGGGSRDISGGANNGKAAGAP